MKPDIKALQIQLTGFLDKDTAPFCKELWKLFLSAQSSPQGVPKELLEAKKLELIQEKVLEATPLPPGQDPSLTVRNLRSKPTELPKKPNVDERMQIDGPGTSAVAGTVATGARAEGTHGEDDRIDPATDRGLQDPTATEIRGIAATSGPSSVTATCPTQPVEADATEAETRPVNDVQHGLPQPHATEGRRPSARGQQPLVEAHHLEVHHHHQSVVDAPHHSREALPRGDVSKQSDPAPTHLRESLDRVAAAPHTGPGERGRKRRLVTARMEPPETHHPLRTRKTNTHDRGQGAAAVPNQTPDPLADRSTEDGTHHRLLPDHDDALPRGMALIASRLMCRALEITQRAQKNRSCRIHP